MYFWYGIDDILFFIVGVKVMVVWLLIVRVEFLLNVGYLFVDDEVILEKILF